MGGGRYNGLSSNNNRKQSQKQSKQVFSARVSKVILDDSDTDLFDQNGGWSSIGGILFTKNTKPNKFKKTSETGYARPLFTNLKNYPLENEIVYIIPLPSADVGSDVNSMAYYYFQPINIWNSVHHNAVPDPLANSTQPDSQKQDYTQTEAGSVRRPTDESSEIPLGETFKEKLDIRSVLPFEGDIIHEGRWGQSIRFGSTVKGSNILSPWSSTGEDGDPIIIFRNGQYDDGEDPWVPILEDINQDLTSIYFTSYQTIPIEAASTDYNSYNEAPTKPDEYDKPQVILSSGRLFFNAREDSVLFSAKKSIGFSSQDSVNVDAKNEFIVHTPKIYLGSKKADEPIILGNKFLDDFKGLMNGLATLCTQLTTVGSVTPYTPNINVAQEATKLQVTARKMAQKIKQYQSKTSFSK